MKQKKICHIFIPYIICMNEKLRYSEKQLACVKHRNEPPRELQNCVKPQCVNIPQCVNKPDTMCK